MSPVWWLSKSGQARAPHRAALARPLAAGEFDPPLRTRLLVLQPTPFCNLDCDYCYLPARDSRARMSIETVRLAARRLVDDGLVGEQLTVVWHAGEPLVVPPSFYEQAVEAIAQTIGAGCAITHCIQTNATLIDEKWCALFARHGIRVGVSVDGPAALHDRHRKTRDQRGTHAAVLRGLGRLREQSIPFHAIAVVTDATLEQADAFFDFFMEQGVRELGCNFDEAEGLHGASSLGNREAAHRAFLDRLLERSIRSGGRLTVREFANALALLAADLPAYRWDGAAWPDNAQVIPFALVSVAHNGEFSTFSPELLGQRSELHSDFVLGNVVRDAYLESTRGETFRRLWVEIRRGTAACRERCAYFRYCGGGSPVNKLYENGSFATAETLYCRTMLKRPFDAVLDRLERDRAKVIGAGRYGVT